MFRGKTLTMYLRVHQNIWYENVFNFVKLNDKPDYFNFEMVRFTLWMVVFLATHLMVTYFTTCSFGESICSNISETIIKFTLNDINMFDRTHTLVPGHFISRKLKVF